MNRTRNRKLLWHAQFCTAVILIAIIFAQCGVKNTEQEKLAALTDSIVQKENHFSPFYNEFLKSGIRSVPYLIEKINTYNRGIVGYDSGDPRLPFKYPINYQYTGCRAAYMIECLLSSTKNARIYNFCVILRLVNGKPNIGPLTASDMENIKKIYSEWWDKNKLRSGKELREFWKSNKRPLTGTDYAWY